MILKKRRLISFFVAVAVVLTCYALFRTFVYRYAGYPLAFTPSFTQEIKQRLGLARFYSQFGQDKWVIGSVFPGVKDGYFVDIGAGDGIYISNTKALEDLGWKGIAVEPFPTHFENRKCLLFKEVVGSRKGQIVEFNLAGLNGGIGDHLAPGNPAKQAKSVKLVTTTIGDILERAKAPTFIHFVSLDTEGSEYEILKAFPFNRYRVGAWAIEHNNEEPNRTNVRKLLEANGYRFARQQIVDDWYVAR